jgi:hypothetical protein
MGASVTAEEPNHARAHRHESAVGRARPSHPTPIARHGQAQQVLALFTTEHDAIRESRRATPEEIDQVFSEQLAAHPDSAFLREVVADRARRRLAGEGLAHAGVETLLTTFAEQARLTPALVLESSRRGESVAPGQRG